MFNQNANLSSILWIRPIKLQTCPTKMQTIRSQNVTQIAAMSSITICGFKLHKGGINQLVFGEFSKEHFESLATSTYRKVVLIMDNVAFYKTESIRSIIEHSGHKLLLLPSYSQFLSPIEEVFNQPKSEVGRMSPRSHEDLIHAIEKSQEKVTSTYCKNHWRHSKSYFLIVLKK